MLDWREFEAAVDARDGEWQSRAVHGEDSPAFFCHLPTRRHAVLQSWSNGGRPLTGPLLDRGLEQYESYRQRDIDLFVAFAPGGFTTAAEDIARRQRTLKVVLVSEQGVVRRPRLPPAEDNLIDALERWLARAPARTLPQSKAIEPVRALVIGNQSYRPDRLNNCVADARAFCDLLNRLGHTATGHYDLKLRDMDRAIESFSRTVGQNDGALFYFSGHGIECEGDNWIIPVDCRSRNDRELVRQAIRVDDVLKSLRKAKFRVTILDACRNNPFRGLSRGGDCGLVQRELPGYCDTHGDLISYACSPKRTADDGPRGKHGPYAAALLRHFATPGASILEVMQAVREEVRRKTGRRQIPWDNTSLTARWYPAGR